MFNRIISISLTIGTALVTIICCERDNAAIPAGDNALVMTIGTTCGWCAGTDSLVIRKDSSLYVYLSRCDDRNYEISAATSQDECLELNDLLNIEEFEKILINTCYVCVDGCDTWIAIRND